MTNLSLDTYAVSCSTSLHGNYDLYSLAAVNILLSVTATLGNIIILFALRKESSLHPPSKLLYLSLTITDLLVGLLSHPLFVVHLFLIVDPQRVPYCCTFAMISIGDMAGMSISGVSLCTLTAISVDRLLALLLGLGYKQTVTLRRTRSVVFFIWIFSVLISFLWRFWSQAVIQGLISAMICINLAASALCYSKIYFSLRHHTQDLVQRRLVNGEGGFTSIARYKKTVSAALWVQLTLLACYLPFSIVTAVVDPFSIPNLLYKRVTITLVFFNSSLNPVLYCWKIRVVRKAAIESVRRMYSIIWPCKTASVNIEQPGETQGSRGLCLFSNPRLPWPNACVTVNYRRANTSLMRTATVSPINITDASMKWTSTTTNLQTYTQHAHVNFFFFLNSGYNEQLAASLFLRFFMDSFHDDSLLGRRLKPFFFSFHLYWHWALN